MGFLKIYRFLKYYPLIRSFMRNKFANLTPSIFKIFTKNNKLAEAQALNLSPTPNPLSLWSNSASG